MRARPASSGTNSLVSTVGFEGDKKSACTKRLRGWASGAFPRWQKAAADRTKLSADRPIPQCTDGRDFVGATA
jgi:hypothetical protein